MGLAPATDEMAGRGTYLHFRHLCAARLRPGAGQHSSLHSLYPSRLRCLRKTAIHCLRPDSTTLASTLRQSGYTANYIGKWHLGESNSRGPVAPDYRGGFLDLWQASNELEWTSHPYEGDLYDNQGEPLHFSGVYRTDFMTDLAQKFLRLREVAVFLLDPFLPSKCTTKTISMLCVAGEGIRRPSYKDFLGSARSAFPRPVPRPQLSAGRLLRVRGEDG